MEPARDPFGALLPGESVPHPTGAVDDQTLAFAGAYGRAALPQSELVQLGARTYDPDTGAFTTRDPVVGPAGEPGRRVAYLYAGASPARYLDLGGRAFYDPVWNPIKHGIDRPARGVNDWATDQTIDPNANAVENAIGWVAGPLSSLLLCENVGATMGTVIPIPGPGKIKGLGKLGALAGGAGGKAGFKAFTSRNFRENLMRLTGGAPAGAQAHHVFPQKFADKFGGLGIDIHDPRYGAWWSQGPHLRASRRINDEWAEFFVKGPSRQEVLDFGRRQAQKNGLNVWF